jgi:uncharacterized protein (TIGR00730 family)
MKPMTTTTANNNNLLCLLFTFTSILNLQPRLVSDMHQRKHKMHQLSNYFIAVPGGFGTLEELLETITWAQLGIHRKPIGLLNVDDYYTPLLQMFRQGIEQEFIGAEFGNSVVVVDSDGDRLVEKLLKHQAPGEIGRAAEDKQYFFLF